MKYVHIAGTNAKGSVAEYISNIITAAGLKCGCYTSPHLISPTERMRIDGEKISAAELKALMDEVREKKLAVNDSLFANYTASALLYFERSDVDIAVMETGIGGRLDPTNVIIPSVVVLTPIDYDHMDLLGGTIEEIAAEKCGIIKAGVPLVSAAQRREAEAVIRSFCRRLDSPLKFSPRAEVTSESLEGQDFGLYGEDYHIAAIGLNQPDNAVLSILAAKELGIDTDSIIKGLKNTRIKCRAEYIKGKPEMIIDGGHNPAAVAALLATLDKYFISREKVLLFACMKDKDYASAINGMEGVFTKVFVTRVDYERGADTETLCAEFSKLCICETELDANLAYYKAKEFAKKTGALLVVSGSFYLAGYISKIMEEENQIS